MFRFIGALFLGAVVGALAERFGLVRNGYVVSIALAVGGAIMAWFIQGAVGINFGLGRTWSVVLGAALLLFLNTRRR